MNPTELLQQLIRFDTTNPPGNEKKCILWIKELLDKAGIRNTILSKDPERPNIIARIEGQKKAPPLLIYGHVDVVSTKGQQWTHSPFEGVIEDGFIWGRGALDMKGGIAMMLSAFLKLAETGFKPSGDIIFAALSDEESGGDFGAKFLVEQHPDYFKDVKYALGEFGGFPVYIGGKCFYFIQTGEKQRCWMKATLNGPGGHGSQRHTGGTMAKLGKIIRTFDKKRMPVHVTPIVKDMVERIAGNVSLPERMVFKQILSPFFTDKIIDLMGERGGMFDPLLHNTVNITMVNGGDKVNVIPSEISFHMDGRILPGFRPDDMLSEIRQLAGDGFSIEIQKHEPCPPKPDMALFNMLGGIIEKAHPGAIPVPFLLPGITDACFFSRLGIQTYGFLPMNLPKDFTFNKLIHAADERIPEYCLLFGTNAIYDVFKQYSGS